LADQIALNNALHYGNHVAIFSLEVTVEQKPRKFAQIMSGHSWRNLPKLHEKDRVEFLQALHEIKKCKRLHVSYRDQSVDAICSRIRVMRQQMGLKLAIIDYLQLMKMGGDGTRNDIIGEATRKIKLLALELNMPIIVLSQLSRANEKEGRRPRLSDLRDSGNIESDADRVLLIDRPLVNPLTNMQQDFTDHTIERLYQEIIQAKGRDVGCAEIGLYFNRACTRFQPAQKENR